MGKRRERPKGCDHNKDDSSLLLSSSSDAMPCSSGFVMSKKKKYPRSVDSKETKPGASGMDMASDGSIKQLNAHMPSHSRHNLGQSMFLKPSRHGHQQHHPWRNSSNNFRASTSHGRSSNWDDRLSFKLGGHYKPQEYGYAEARERMLGMPERITAADDGLPDAMRIPCGICHNLLWERPVVAVLVCGHLFHADCLERKTPPEDKCDPPCSICSSKP